jgi:hypothetical protein
LCRILLAADLNKSKHERLSHARDHRNAVADFCLCPERRPQGGGGPPIN